MKLNDKIKLFIDKGFSYNPSTGDIITGKGKLVKARKNDYIICGIRTDSKIIYIYAHQLAFYISNGYVCDFIDHEDRDKSNNKISNLRCVTNQQNQFNRNAKGYYWNKRSKKFESRITLDGNKMYIGAFDTEFEAHQAYLEAKKIYHII